MAVIIPITGTTTVSLNVDDILYLAEDVSITTTGSEAIDASSSADDNVELYLYGTVAAFDWDAIDLGGDNVTATIYGDVVSGGERVSTTTRDTRTITVSGNDGQLVNYGTVTGPTPLFFSTADDWNFVNYGTLSASGIGSC